MSELEVRVIPDIVLHRYTELLSQQPIAADELAQFISWDAQLLSGWCALLGCDPSVVDQRIDELDSGTCADLGLAVVMAQVNAQPRSPAARPPRETYPSQFGAQPNTQPGSADMDAWGAHLTSAQFGGLLGATYAGLDQEHARRLCLLALAEEPLSDQGFANYLLLQEMIEFRGEPAEYLRDAHPMLQVFCVVDAHHNQEEAVATQAAQTLLNCAPEAFSQTVHKATEQTDRDIETVLRGEDQQRNWHESLWERLRILALSGAIARAATVEELLAANRLVAGDLFDHEPLLLQAQPETNSLQAINHADAAQLRVDLESTASRIAASVRSATVTELIDRPSSLVAERQLLRRLGSSAAFVHPLHWNGELVGACVFARSPGEVQWAAARRAYAQDLAEWFGAEQPASVSSMDAHAALSEPSAEYSAQLEKRLREIVHEANNPLSVVRNYLHILDMRLQDNPRAQEQIQLIGDELRRASDVIRQVIDVPQDLEFNAPLESAQFDLNAVAEQVCDLLGAGLATQNIRVHAQLEQGTIVLHSHRDRVVQVLTNLVKNAVEALLDHANGGEVVVSTGRGVYRAGREGVEVRVRDTAGGLPADVLQALFDPKTSTKGGNHEGLGLHIVRNLVGELQGEIDVRTRAGEGTEFAIFLPAAPVSAE